MSSQPFEPPKAPPPQNRPTTWSVQLGARPNPLAAGLSGITGFSFPQFRFGARCACCFADAGGKTIAYDAGNDRIKVPPIAVPICGACKSHAQTSTSAAQIGVGFGCASVAGIALAIMYLQERPEDTFLWGMLVVCILITLGIIAWFWSANRRDRELAHAGHHAAITIGVASGVIILSTTHRAFAEELIQLNPGAKFR